MCRRRCSRVLSLSLGMAPRLNEKDSLRYGGPRCAAADNRKRSFLFGGRAVTTHVNRFVVGPDAQADRRITPHAAHSMRVTREEFAQRGIEAVRLFLLHPVPGFLDEVWAGERGACRRHGLEGARALICAPVAAAGDEAGGHFDAAAVEGL